MKETGIVKEIKGSKLIIETVPGSECKGCGACDGGKSRQMIMEKGNFDYNIGDPVTIQIDSSVMLKLYVYIYTLPLIAFILSIVIIYNMLQNPIISFLIAFPITFSTYFLVGRYLRNKAEFMPSVVPFTEKS